MCSIGAVYHAQSKYGKALESWHKSLEINLKVLGRNHLDVAKTQHNIANIFWQQGKYPEALEMYKKSLATKEKVLGPEHLDMADMYNKYALAFVLFGPY